MVTFLLTAALTSGIVGAAIRSCIFCFKGDMKMGWIILAGLGISLYNMWDCHKAIKRGE